MRPCDASQYTDDHILFAAIRLALPPLRGVWHTAGVLADGLVAQQNAKQFRHVHGPKVTGAGYMHCAIRQNLCSCAYTFRLSLDLSEALDRATTQPPTRA